MLGYLTAGAQAYYPDFTRVILQIIMKLSITATLALAGILLIGQSALASDVPKEKESPTQESSSPPSGSSNISIDPNTLNVLCQLSVTNVMAYRKAGFQPLMSVEQGGRLYRQVLPGDTVKVDYALSGHCPRNLKISLSYFLNDESSQVFWGAQEILNAAAPSTPGSICFKYPNYPVGTPGLLPPPDPRPAQSMPPNRDEDSYCLREVDRIYAQRLPGLSPERYAEIDRQAAEAYIACLRYQAAAAQAAAADKPNPALDKALDLAYIHEVIHAKLIVKAHLSIQDFLAANPGAADSIPTWEQLSTVEAPVYFQPPSVAQSGDNTPVVYRDCNVPN